MGLKIKKGVSLETLRKYGFKPADEYKDDPSGYLSENGLKYQAKWWHKFMMDPDDPGRILIDPETEKPVIHVAIRTDGTYDNTIYMDCVPYGTYHVGGDEMDLVADTVFEMTKDGILEKP